MSSDDCLSIEFNEPPESDEPAKPNEPSESNEPPGSEELKSKRHCVPEAVIHVHLASGFCVCSHTVTEEVEEETVMLGILQYLCKKWGVPSCCLEAAWTSPMGLICDATLIIKEMPFNYWYGDGCIYCGNHSMETTHFTDYNRYDTTCTRCAAVELCKHCRIILPARCELLHEDLSHQVHVEIAETSFPVCIACATTEELLSTAPKQIWLHQLRQKCFGIYDD